MKRGEKNKVKGRKKDGEKGKDFWKEETKEKKKVKMSGDEVNEMK